MKQKEHPSVFISYSHDDEPHKTKVRQLGDGLREKHGIDVVGDFYEEDMPYGKLLSKFMEKGIDKADKVLVVLTPKYKVKADEGDGGVGYEGTILTREIYSNIHTVKIIPIILAEEDIKIDDYSPTFLSLRLGILRRDFDTEEEFLEEIARAVFELPKKPKPLLGKSPILLSEQQIIRTMETELDIQSIIQDEVALYKNAYFYAVTDQKMAYRKLLRETTKKVFEDLRNFREKQEKSFNVKEESELAVIMDKFVDIAKPLFLIAFAGVSSDRDNYKNQKGLLFDLLSIDKWFHRQGQTYNVILQVPKFLGFVYHHLYGALLIYLEEYENIWSILEQKVPDENTGEFKHAYEVGSIIGFVDSLGRNCFQSFRFLFDAYQKWSWLAFMFSSEDEYKKALVIYQCVMNLYGFFAGIHEDSGDNQINNGEIVIPPSFMIVDEGCKAYAINQLIKHRHIFTEFLKPTKLSKLEIQHKWNQFLTSNNKFLTFWFERPYNEKFIDLLLA